MVRPCRLQLEPVLPYIKQGAVIQEEYHAKMTQTARKPLCRWYMQGSEWRKQEDKKSGEEVKFYFRGLPPLYTRVSAWAGCQAVKSFTYKARS